MKNKIKLIDCTLRDGGYYNSWDFSIELINDYLKVMHGLPVDYVELGFRSFKSDDFKGGCAYTTDVFLDQLTVPKGLKLGAMINAGEIIKHKQGMQFAISKLFKPAKESPLTLVRIACHLHEFENALPGCSLLKEMGYEVGVNIMQISESTKEEIKKIAYQASKYPIDVLYFADSLGSMSAQRTSEVINNLRSHWEGSLGIHTHDNMGRAMDNSMRAISDGVTWVDSTVTGMGRGPGNLQTEYLVIEIAEMKKISLNIKPLISLINRYFKPLQKIYEWGMNPYYYLSGKNSIHPMFVQTMLSDQRYDAEDLLTVIDNLKKNNGQKFNMQSLESGLNFYKTKPLGSWSPLKILKGKEVLIIGAGVSASRHRVALESFINKFKPLVIGLNTIHSISKDLIDVCAASHPIRILSDCSSHLKLPQPLIIPASMLPKTTLSSLDGKKLLDFGIDVKIGKFNFYKNYCTVPSTFVLAYALGIAASGRAKRIFLSGFDGYGADDPRTSQIDELFNIFKKTSGSPPFLSITSTSYKIKKTSVYSMI
jgi:4-hydroxy 2-oxovalerate aldolase